MGERSNAIRPAQLVVHQVDQPDRQIPLHGEGYRIGREDSMEVPLGREPLPEWLN